MAEGEHITALNVPEMPIGPSYLLSMVEVTVEMVSHIFPDVSIVNIKKHSPSVLDELVAADHGETQF